MKLIHEFLVSRKGLQFLLDNFPGDWSVEKCIKGLKCIR